MTAHPAAGPAGRSGNLSPRLNPGRKTGDVSYMQQGGRSFPGELTAADLRSRSKLWSNRRREPRIPCERELAILSAERQSIPRRGYAEDLTGTFVYLASDDSAFVTGQVITVDGGWVHH